MSAPAKCTSQLSRSGGPVISGSISAAASAMRPPASSASEALEAKMVARHEACKPACRADPSARNATSAALANLASLSSASLSFAANHTRALPSSVARARVHPRPRTAKPSSTWPRRNAFAAILASTRGIKAVAPVASAIFSARFSARRLPSDHPPADHKNMSA